MRQRHSTIPAPAGHLKGQACWGRLDPDHVSMLVCMGMCIGLYQDMFHVEEKSGHPRCNQPCHCSPKLPLTPPLLPVVTKSPMDFDFAHWQFH